MSTVDFADSITTLSARRTGVSALPFWPRHLEPISRTAVLNSAHAADEVQGVAIYAAIFPMFFIDVNGKNLPDDETATLRWRRKIQNLIHLAFETHAGLCHLW